MGGFSEQFQGYIVPSKAALRAAVTEGMIVLDTNVLLSAYRFAPAARQELLAVLDLVRERLWVPHQVALEFHQNRFDVIAEHDAAYKLVLDAVQKHQMLTANELEDKIRQLANRAELADKERKSLLLMAKTNLEPLREAVESLRQQHGVSDPTNDPILARFQELFAGRVGSPFNESEDEASRHEAERRVKKKIPPGYRDAGKEESHGDYFVWRQALAEVERRQAKALIFVTGDTKEDWYLRVKGQTVMAHPYLMTECWKTAGAMLHMMQIQSLLYHAKTYLQAQVSADTIRQAREISAADAAAARLRELRVLLDDNDRFIQDVLTQSHDAERELVALAAEEDSLRIALAQIDRQPGAPDQDARRKEALSAKLVGLNLNQSHIREKLERWRQQMHALKTRAEDLSRAVWAAEMEHLEALRSQ